MEKPAIKRKVGGFRPGSGRKPGTLNKSTIQRHKAVAKQVEAVLAKLSDTEVDSMNAIAVLRHAMRVFLKANDLLGAVSVARDLIQYESPKVASATPNQPTADELLPDPAPEPDEPGPARIIE